MQDLAEGQDAPDAVLKIVGIGVPTVNRHMAEDAGEDSGGDAVVLKDVDGGILGDGVDSVIATIVGEGTGFVLADGSAGEGGGDVGGGGVEDDAPAPNARHPLADVDHALHDAPDVGQGRGTGVRGHGSGKVHHGIDSALRETVEGFGVFEADAPDVVRPDACEEGVVAHAPTDGGHGVPLIEETLCGVGTQVPGSSKDNDLHLSSNT